MTEMRSELPHPGLSGPDLLRVENLHVHFSTPAGVVKAVQGANFRVRPGSTVAIVGESGSGKSVISQAIMGILPRVGHIAGGKILFADPRSPGSVVDIAAAAARRTADAPHPRRPHLDHLPGADDLAVAGPHRRQPGRARRSACIATSAPARRATSPPRCCASSAFPIRSEGLRTYPFELSGGLRQRAMIAMALVCSPALLIADEPTTALDVTIQAQILKLMLDLQQELGMAVMIITHDLGVVANVAEEIVVMYHGSVVESGTIEDLFRDPQHPYLRALLQAVPRFDMPEGERLIPIREIRPGKTGHLMAAKAEWPEDATGPLLSFDRCQQGLSHPQVRRVRRRSAPPSPRSTRSASRSSAASASASSARAAAARRR